jgi:hypothetical protein
MLKPNDKLNEAEAGTANHRSIDVAALYGAGIIAVLALVFTNRTISDWITSASQAEITGSIGKTGIDPTQLTQRAKNLPVTEVKEPF